MHYSKKFLVYLEFDDEQMMITAKSIFIHHINVIVSQIPYSNLKLENSENQYDGMTRGTYLAMHLYDRNKNIGMLLQNHFVWPNSEFALIHKKLLEITKEK
ncbi:MAG: hypothetical protein AAF731_19230 [Bacteroidota bacterium]